MAATQPATGTATVTIACKLPNGFRLRLFTKIRKSEAVMGGGFRDVEMFQPTGEEIVINGWSHPQNKAPHCTIEGGFALTPGVPKDFWDAWLSQNKDALYVKNGLVFAHENYTKAVDESREKEKLRSGFERLNPDEMPRNLKRVTKEDDD